MEIKYALQHKDYGLGNFCNLSLVLYNIWADTGEPVKVFFESDYVKKVFEGEKWLKVLKERPNNKPFISSSLIDKSNTKPDWRYLWERFSSGKFAYPPGIKKQEYVVFLNGCATDEKRHTKDPGCEIYQRIFDKIKNKYRVIFTGSHEDGHNYNGPAHLVATGDPKLAKCLIDNCEFIVSNDTGFYHYAGLLNKPGFIIWKDTLRVKNRAMGKRFRYSFDDHFNNFESWYRTFKAPF